MSDDAPRPKRILVVDDNPDDRHVVKRYLSRDRDETYDVLEASEPEEGLRLFEELPPDVVVLDQHLGQQTGLELLQELRRRGHHEVAVIMLTGSSGRTSAAQLLEAGADDYLRKEELSARHLRRAISNAIVKARLRAELERTQRRLTDALDELEQRLEFESRLVSVVGHDLRTPLNAILMGIDALDEDEDLSEEGRVVLGAMDRSATRVRRIVSQLLDLTRVRNAEGFPLEREPLDACELVQHTVEEVRATFPEHEIRVSCEGPGSGSFDPTALGQLAGNLISNACRHGAPDAPVHVRVSASETHVRLEVENGGRPIPPARLTQLYRPFQRAHENDDRLGLGLGLYIVRAIVEAHGGTIEASSDETSTRFTVKLPKHAPAPTEG